MSGKSRLAFLAFLLLFCPVTSATLLVDLSPKDPGLQTLTLYPEEIGEYSLSVINTGDSPAESVVLELSTVPGLKIIEAGTERSATSMRVDSIKPGEKKSFIIKVKPTDLSPKKLFVYVNYGVGIATHNHATFLTVVEGPLQINSSLSKTALDVGGEASIRLSLSNTGREPIRNISAELVAFRGLESLDGDVSLELLEPGEGYEAKEFMFRADPSATGQRYLVMRVVFEDSLGRHVIERGFSVEIQSKQMILYIIVIIIVLLVIVALLSRKGESKAIKKLEKPIVEELKPDESSKK